MEDDWWTPADAAPASVAIMDNDYGYDLGGLGRGRGRNKKVNRVLTADFEGLGLGPSGDDAGANANPYDFDSRPKGQGCFKCGGEGHMARECPTGGDGGGGGSRKPLICYNCGQEGHTSRDCANERVERPPRSARSGGGGGGGGPRKCYNCGEEGHLGRECTNERVENADRPQRTVKTCFRCGVEGHTVRDCSEEPTEKEMAPRPDGGIDGFKYIPPEIPKGDELFEERKNLYKGVGEHFGNYALLRAEVTGEGKVPHVRTFAELGLQEQILKNLKKCGHEEPTPIQKHGSPQLLAGLNVLSYAQTGSGKTAAFLLPTLCRLLNQFESLSPPATAPASPEALILAPTRELVNQIATEANMYGADTGINVRVIYGGASMNDQKYQLLRGCNILIATPGRLIHYLAEKMIDLSRIQIFILDESDRMLDLGFMPDVDKIVARLPPIDNRQTGMFFSARMPKDLREILADKYLKTHVKVEIGIEGGACADVKQEFIEIDKAEKKTKIVEILQKEDKKNKVLVFCGSKKGTDFLAFHISNSGVPCTSIHGDRFQNQREEALRDFTYGRHQVLVASDVAARGLDIPEVELVVNYDLPADVETYVLRIGRTGRVGHAGRALSFYDHVQDSQLIRPLKDILAATNQPVPPFFDTPSYLPKNEEMKPQEGNAFDIEALEGEDEWGGAVAATAVKPKVNMAKVVADLNLSDDDEWA